MTKLLREMIDAENKRRGKQYPQIGALTTFTRGFGQHDDIRIAEIVNAGGGIRSLCHANARAFQRYLDAEEMRAHHMQELKRYAREMLKQEFPWLGTDDDVNGGDVVNTLNELYVHLGFEVRNGN